MIGGQGPGASARPLRSSPALESSPPRRNPLSQARRGHRSATISSTDWVSYKSSCPPSGSARATSLSSSKRSCGDLAWRRRAISEAAMDKLCAHGWPGNVRELLHVLQRAAAMSSADVLDEADLDLPDDTFMEVDPTEQDLAFTAIYGPQSGEGVLKTV